MKPKGTWRERLMARIEYGENGCWNFIGKNCHGYGIVWLGNGRTTTAHRAFYLELKGAIAEGLVLDHLCRNKRCVNPNHLEPVTHLENIRRAVPFNGLAARTECKNGHPFTAENTARHHRNGRRCRKCDSNYQKDARERMRGRLPTLS